MYRLQISEFLFPLLTNPTFPSLWIRQFRPYRAIPEHPEHQVTNQKGYLQVSHMKKIKYWDWEQEEKKARRRVDGHNQDSALLLGTTHPARIFNVAR